MSEFLKGVQQGAAIAQLRHQIQSEKDKILEMMADRMQAERQFNAQLLQTQRYRDAQLQQEQAYNTERLQTQKSYYDAIGDQRMKEFEMTKLRGQREEDERMNKSNRAGLVSAIDSELLSDPTFISKPRAEREAIRADRLRVAGLTEEGDDALGMAAKFTEGKGKEGEEKIVFETVKIDGEEHRVPAKLKAKFSAMMRVNKIEDPSERAIAARKLANQGWPTTLAEYEVLENELLNKAEDQSGMDVPASEVLKAVSATRQASPTIPFQGPTQTEPAQELDSISTSLEGAGLRKLTEDDRKKLYAAKLKKDEGLRNVMEREIIESEAILRKYMKKKQ